MLDIRQARRTAIQYEQSGRYLASSIILERVVECSPEDSFAWLVLSDSYKFMGWFSRCRLALEQALLNCLDDRKWIIYSRLAVLEAKRGNSLEADKWFELASLEQGASDAQWIGILRAENLLRIEEFSRAEQIIRAVIDKGDSMEDPDEAYNVLGLSLLGQDRYVEARDALTESFRLAPVPNTAEAALLATESIEEALQIVATSHD